MARIRSVHPSFFTDEACVSCSALARLLYIGLWTEADDQGLFEWRPLQLKIRLLPADPCDAGALLTELLNAGLIAPFELSAAKFGAIKGFRRFQRPKKPNAVHVLPDEWRTYVAIDDRSGEPAATYEPESSTPRADERVGVGNQFGTGGEKPPQMEDGGESEDVGEGRGDAPKRRATRLLGDWVPSDIDRAYALKAGFSAPTVERIAEKFRNFWTAKSGSGATKLDWHATWRNWVLEEAERRGIANPQLSAADKAIRSNII